MWQDFGFENVNKGVLMFQLMDSGMKGLRRHSSMQEFSFLASNLILVIVYSKNEAKKRDAMSSVSQSWT